MDCSRKRNEGMIEISDIARLLDISARILSNIAYIPGMDCEL